MRFIDAPLLTLNHKNIAVSRLPLPERIGKDRKLL
jgi:hypothetical protein